jgi:DNA (cytosine-5)-methyltransferase 1
LEAAGITIVGGIESDVDSCATYAKAHPGARVLERDIRVVRWSEFDGVDLVVGGPPCQPWSIGGLRRGEVDHRDGWPSFVRALRELRPKAFLAENVAGLTQGLMRARWERLVDELTAVGYTVTARVLNAADYGVPQRRRRCMIVGVRAGDAPFAFPCPTHGHGHRWPWRPAGSVLASAPFGQPNPATVTYALRPDLRRDPYGGHVFNGGGRPIDLRAPAPTLLASMGGNKTPWVDTLGIVPRYHAHLSAGGRPRRGRVPGARRITVEEAALLQSFASGAGFVGARSSQYRQVGNAVPPRLAEVVGRAIARRFS